MTLLSPGHSKLQTFPTSYCLASRIQTRAWNPSQGIWICFHPRIHFQWWWRTALFSTLWKWGRCYMGDPGHPLTLWEKPICGKNKSRAVRDTGRPDSLMRDPDCHHETSPTLNLPAAQPIKLILFPFVVECLLATTLKIG